MNCPACGAEMLLRTTSRFSYRDGSPRKFYGCSNYPRCKTTVGAHQNGEPMGFPGDAETKGLRIAAHSWLKRVIMENNWKRNDAYSWLAARMGLDIEGCHIAMFDKDRCLRAIDVCRQEMGVMA